MSGVVFRLLWVEIPPETPDTDRGPRRPGRVPGQETLPT